jgi:hypothetical protein
MRTVIVTSSLVGGYLLVAESFQPGLFVSQQNHHHHQQQQPSTVWGLPLDRRLSLPLYSTTSASSSKAETEKDDESDKKGSDTETHLESINEEKPLQQQQSEPPSQKDPGTNNEESEEPMIVVSDNVDPEEKLSMPWSTVQEWALRDHLPKYTVMIPLNNNDSKNEKETTNVYALWRTMLMEVPELAGYPMEFLQERHAKQIESSETTLMDVTPALLPYLDDYEFAAAGGIAGKIYGIPGLADGTRIETSSVTNIEVTLPKGFIRTSDGSAAYELGRPNNTREENRSNAITASSLNAAMQSGSYELLKTVQSNAAPQGEIMEDANGMLVRLGASTAILLAGATAISMLSHHMTVNVFWV